MQGELCTCTALVCGHAHRERCSHLAVIFLRIAVGNKKSRFDHQAEITLCEGCWERLQMSWPEMFYCRLPNLPSS
jgi:hypothetical protein